MNGISYLKEKYLKIIKNTKPNTEVHFKEENILQGNLSTWQNSISLTLS